MLSDKFAHLPNGIIREIISYTGVTYKKRNGKYIGQIQKDDERYALLLTIPTKILSFQWIETDYKCFICYVNLTQEKNDYQSISLYVKGIKYDEDDYIISNVIVCDYNTGIQNKRIYEHIHGNYHVKLKRLEDYMWFYKRMFICSFSTMLLCEVLHYYVKLK